MRPEMLVEMYTVTEPETNAQLELGTKGFAVKEQIYFFEQQL